MPPYCIVEVSQLPEALRVATKNEVNSVPLP